MSEPNKSQAPPTNLPVHEVIVGSDKTVYRGCTHSDALTEFRAAVETHGDTSTILWLKDGELYRSHGAHDVPTLLAAHMFKVSASEVTADMRRAAKSVSHASLYKPWTVQRSETTAGQKHLVVVESDDFGAEPYYEGDSYDDALAEFTECVDRLGDASTVEWWADGSRVKKHTPPQTVDRGLIDEHLTDTITNALKLARSIGMNTGALMERCVRHLEVELPTITKSR